MMYAGCILMGNLIRQRINRVRGLLASLSIVLSVLLIFQNCSDPIMTDPETAASSASVDAPFAYSVTASHFGYMSCTNSTIDDSASHFTFRFGAYSDGFGLGLTSAFLNATSSETKERRKEILQSSPINQNVNLQLAIRAVSDLRSDMTVNSRNPILKKDYDLILPKLDSQAMANALIDNSALTPQRLLRSISGVPGLTNNRLEGSIRSFNGDSSAQSFRAAVDSNQNGSGILTLGFVEDEGSGNFTPRSPAGVDTMYGKGFSPHFSSAFFASNATSPTFTTAAAAGIKIVTGVNEVDLATGAAGSDSQWVCPASMRFMIVRKEDVQTGNSPGVFMCGTNEDPATLTPELQHVRRILRADAWYVDMTRRCIVEKAEVLGVRTNVCYGSSASVTWVNYTGDVGPANGTSGDRGAGSQACGTYRDGNGSSQNVTVRYNGQTRTVACPHYVSVCYRNAGN